MSQEELYNKYKGLWVTWSIENPELMKDLVEKSQGKVLTDMFANTTTNQARALSEVINELGYAREVVEQNPKSPLTDVKPEAIKDNEQDYLDCPR
jgi:hypothetical protein